LTYFVSYYLEACDLLKLGSIFYGSLPNISKRYVDNLKFFLSMTQVNLDLNAEAEIQMFNGI
jgi:hypothetical protein